MITCFINLPFVYCIYQNDFTPRAPVRYVPGVILIWGAFLMGGIRGLPFKAHPQRCHRALDVVEDLLHVL